MSDRQEFVRVPPQSIEAEQAVIGGILLVPEYWDRVASILVEKDFHRRDHQLIWRAIGELQNQRTPPDAVTLGEWFEAQGIAQLVGGSRYILDLANSTPSAANIGAYAKIVRHKAMLRNAIKVGDRLMAEAWAKDADADAVIDGAVRELMTLCQSNASHEMSIRDACNQVLADIKATLERGGALAGLTTGIVDLDEKLGGFHGGDFVVIAARPSVGKTSLLGFMVAAAAKTGAPVGLFSAEQPAKQIAARLMSAESRVIASHIRSCKFDDGEHARLLHNVEKTRALPITINDRSAMHIREMERVARRWKIEHGIKAIYVDYVQRLSGDGDSRAERIGDICRGLKGIARDLDIPVIALAQVKREVDTRPDKRPVMSDMSDGSDIEKEADSVGCMYRDDYYNSNSKDAGTVELLWEKNRHGGCGMVRIGWDAKHMDFYDLAFGRERQQQEYFESTHGAGR